MKRLDVLLTREALATTPLTHRICIVLDVLFATSTIVTALASGAQAVWPATSRADAEAIAERLCSPVRLAGEHMAETLDGFDSPLPLALSKALIPGEHVVYATTNGTLALRDAAPAAAVYAAALLNARATALHVQRVHPHADVLIVCSGSVGRFNLEDFRGAAELAVHFAAAHYQFSDAALAARALRDGLPAITALSDSRVGQMMAARHVMPEVEYAAGIDQLDLVAQLHADSAVRTVP